MKRSHTIGALVAAVALAVFAGGARAEAQVGASAARLYDLGNAYQREGRLGYAIATYERAQLLTPRDGDLAANLAHARAAANLPSRHASWYRRAAQTVPPRQWCWLGLAALCLACLALAVVQLQTRGRRLLLSTAVASTLVVAMAIAAVVVAGPGRDDAVVVARNATLRLSPFGGAAAEASVAEGAHVVVTGSHKTFLRVRDEDGKSGWIEAAGIERIL